MKERINAFIKDKRAYSGGVYIYAIVLIYVIIIFSVVYIKFYSIYTIGRRVKETMKEACIYVMTSNWDELFHSIKEGYAGGYNFNGEELIDSERVYNIMQKELEVTRVGDEFIKYGDNVNEIIFKYYDIEMVINNTGFKNRDDSYSIDLMLTFEAPLNISFIKFPIKIDLKHKAKWTAKY